MKHTKKTILLFFLAFSSLLMSGQSSQTLSLEECENLFLKNNLMLLARQFNISAREALIIQAKAYPNPVFSADVNVYDPQHKQFLHVDSSGQRPLPYNS
jgi:cobalt-zinc-cadmium efflux system outer membrane protein